MISWSVFEIDLAYQKLTKVSLSSDHTPDNKTIKN
jgi:hypothetical protein